MTMKIVRSTIQPAGRAYATEELRHVLDARLTELFSKEPRLADENIEDMFSDAFFSRMGVESRHLVVDPERPEEWWEENKGKKPLACAAADIFEALMREEEPLSEADKLIAVSNVFDTTVPSLVSHIISTLRERGSLEEHPEQLSILGEGCSGLISALREANTHLVANPAATVVVVSSEISSPYFYSPELFAFVFARIQSLRPASGDYKYYLNVLKGILVQRLLFGDGSSAFICKSNEAASEGLEINRFKRWSNIEPSDIEIFGVRGIGTHYDSAPPFGYFFQDPKRLLERLRDAYIPAMRFEHDSLAEKPDLYALHMGSGVILDIVSQGLSLTSSESEISRDVLREYGNLNTSSGGFALSKILKRRGRGESVFLAFFGVGFTAQVAY